LGTSISTGPGRPPSASSNARGRICTSSLAVRAKKQALVTGWARAQVSTSWKASVPISARGT
jgi:hypothetical protein